MKKLLPPGFTFYHAMSGFYLTDVALISIKRNTTSMLQSTFGWHFYFTAFSETKSHAILQQQVGLAGVSMKQTYKWPMRKT